MARTLDSIKLWPGVAPGSEEWAEEETEWAMANPLAPGAGALRFAWNVVEPTLTPVLPDASAVTGVGVLVCPGGGYFSLATSYEGFDAASWLADKGIAAFVLKYRVQQTVIQQESDYLNTLMQVASPEGLAKVVEDLDVFGDVPLADGRAALALIRGRADEFGIDPERLGAMGFSAGARLIMDLGVLSDPAERPAFLGCIYGPRLAGSVPADAPPLFTAVSADDPFYVDVKDIEQRWRELGRHVESHYYPDGGHGWGMVKYGRTTDRWIESFHHWVTYVAPGD